MKKHISTIILITVFLVGLSVLLYPSVSNYINQINASHAIVDYDKAMNNLSEVDYEKMLADAEAYNRTLSLKSQAYLNGEPQDKNYISILNITNDGIMGYITIKKLGVQLPIYHGTSEKIMNTAIGHLEGSSLPVGGKGTHSIITGHRGLPAAKLFTDLDKMEIGDTFTITILNEILTYEVDQVLIVLPDEIDELAINKDKDYMTLITCTPYAVNTHRLLVRGIRIDNPDANLRVMADAMQIDPIIVAPIVATPILLILLILLLLGSKNKRKQSLQNKPYFRKGGEQDDES